MDEKQTEDNILEEIKLEDIGGEIKVGIVMGYSYSIGEFEGWVKPGFSIECTIPKGENPDVFVKKLKMYSIKQLQSLDKILNRMVGGSGSK